MSINEPTEIQIIDALQDRMDAMDVLISDIEKATMIFDMRKEYIALIYDARVM